MALKKRLRKVKKHTKKILYNVLVSVISGLILYMIIGQHAATTPQHQTSLPSANLSLTNVQQNTTSDIPFKDTNTVDQEFQGLTLKKDESIVLFNGYFSLGLIDVTFDNKAVINFNLDKNVTDVYVGDTIPFQLGTLKYNMIIREVDAGTGSIIVDVYKL